MISRSVLTKKCLIVEEKEEKRAEPTPSAEEPPTQCECLTMKGTRCRNKPKMQKNGRWVCRQHEKKCLVKTPERPRTPTPKRTSTPKRTPVEEKQPVSPTAQTPVNRCPCITGRGEVCGNIARFEKDGVFVCGKHKRKCTLPPPPSTLAEELIAAMEANARQDSVPMEDLQRRLKEIKSVSPAPPKAAAEPSPIVDLAPSPILQRCPCVTKRGNTCGNIARFEKNGVFACGKHRHTCQSAPEPEPPVADVPESEPSVADVLDSEPPVLIAEEEEEEVDELLPEEEEVVEDEPVKEAADEAKVSVAPEATPQPPDVWKVAHVDHLQKVYDYLVNVPEESVEVGDIPHFEKQLLAYFK